MFATTTGRRSSNGGNAKSSHEAEIADNGTGETVMCGRSRRAYHPRWQQVEILRSEPTTGLLGGRSRGVESASGGEVRRVEPEVVACGHAAANPRQAHAGGVRRQLLVGKVRRISRIKCRCTRCQQVAQVSPRGVGLGGRQGCKR